MLAEFCWKLVHADWLPVDPVHAETNPEICVELHALSDCLTVMYCEIIELDTGPGHAPPSLAPLLEPLLLPEELPLLEPLLDPLLLPELLPDPLPLLLLPEELPEPPELLVVPPSPNPLVVVELLQPPT